MSEPHLFISTDAWGDTSLWFGTGPDDPRPEYVELGGRHGSHPIALRKALWEALAASPLVQDYTAVYEMDYKTKDTL